MTTKKSMLFAVVALLLLPASWGQAEMRNMCCAWMYGISGGGGGYGPVGPSPVSTPEANPQGPLGGTPELNIAGHWDGGSTWGSISFHQSGTHIRAHYTTHEGTITGRLRGNVLEGYWVQRMSDQRCSSPHDNSFYWGKLIWTFTANNFTGMWGYCEAEPQNATEGSRIEPPFGGTPELNIAGRWDEGSAWGSIFFHQSGTHIRAHYTTHEGTITGRLRGNVLEGYWVQPTSDQRCSTPHDNSFYWGKLIWTFTANNFTGTWGYCEAEPQNATQGKRVAR